MFWFDLQLNSFFFVIMNEEGIQNFISITDCDRRTAVYCLLKFGGNLQIALSYYFDIGGSIRIPPDFSLDQTERRFGLQRTASNISQQTTSPTLTQNTQSTTNITSITNHSNSNRSSINKKEKPAPKSTTATTHAKTIPNVPVPPPHEENNKDKNKFIRNYPVEDEIQIPSFLKRKKPMIPEVFFPNPQVSHMLNDNIPSIKKEDICIIPPKANKPSMIQVNEVPHYVIVLYQNGILCDNNDFIQNSDPKYHDLYHSIQRCEIPDIYPCESDVEIINRKDENYSLPQG